MFPLEFAHLGGQWAAPQRQAGSRHASFLAAGAAAKGHHEAGRAGKRGGMDGGRSRRVALLCTAGVPPLLCVRAVELCFPAAVLLLCSVGVVVDLRYGNCKGGAWCCVCYRPRRTNERSTVRAWVGDRNATLLAMRLRLPARPAQRHSACPTLCQSAHRNRRTIAAAAAAAAASETTATGQPGRLARRGRGHT